MHVIKGETLTAFDIDDTMIMWHSDCPPEEKISITCPYGGDTRLFKVHKLHVEFLKKTKGRGNTVIVWSAAGVLWAEAVIKALGLEQYVDYILSKPTKIVDDLTPNEIFPCRIYLRDEK